MKDEIKNGKNVSLDGITVINEGVSLSEKKEVKEEVTPIAEETKNEEPVITPDVQINSTPVAPIAEPVVSMPEPPVIGQTISPTIMDTPIVPNYGMDTFVNPMPEASPAMPSYDYPSFDSKDYSSNFDKVSNKLDFNSIEGIERARKQEIDDINAKYDSIIKLYKDLETFKNWSNNIWKSFTPPTVGNSYNDDSNSRLNTPKF